MRGELRCEPSGEPLITPTKLRVELRVASVSVYAGVHADDGRPRLGLSVCLSVCLYSDSGLGLRG